MVARVVLDMLPDLSLEEALAVTRLYSVADLLPAGTPPIRQRPFRAPHHTISYSGLIGNAKSSRPGEVSLAHHGVLFLGDLHNFDRHSLETVRQVLIDRSITFTRSRRRLTFPSNFMLLAAMDACPCGWHGDTVHPYTCFPATVSLHQRRSLARCGIVLTSISNCRASITRSRRVIERASRMNQFEPASWQHTRGNLSVLKGAACDVTPIWPRRTFASSASWMTRAKR